MQVARKTVRAAGWNYLSFGLSKLIVLITMVILARILNPKDFGIAGFATLAVAYLSLIKDFGLGNALIQRRTDVEKAANTVFTLNLIIGLFLAIVIIFMAPLVADFFHEPIVKVMLCVLSLTFIIEPLGSVHVALLQRELDFRNKLIPDIGRIIFKGFITIGLALGGYGAWSLIIGQLVSVVVAVILSWMVFPWRPTLCVDKKQAHSLMVFSIPLMGFNILDTVIVNLDSTVIGHLLGDKALGIYSLAYRIPDLMIINIWLVLAAVMFPTFASIQHQPDMLRRGFLATTRYLQIIIVPISLSLTLTADPLVRFLLGPKWLEVIPILQLIAIYALIDSIGVTAGDIYKAIGRPSLLWKLGLIHISVLVPCLLIGVKYGLVGIAIGRLITVFLLRSMNLYVAAYVMNLNFLSIIRELIPSIVSGIGLIFLGLPISYMTTGLSPLIQLLLIGSAGLVGYIGTLWWIEKESLLKLADMLRVTVGFEPS
jgi:O-antigen/teichoic acid export membrane protein